MLKTAFALLLLTTAPAMAFDRAFLGTWAPDAPSCDRGGNDWFKVTPKTLEEREGLCTLKGAARAGPGWRMRYSCASDGDEGGAALELTWRMGPNGHLLQQMKGQSKDYIRCDAQKAAVAPSEPATGGGNGQWQGPGRADLKAYVEKQGGMTDLPFPIALYGDFTGDGQEDAIVFIYSDTGGSGPALDVVLFTGDQGTYRFMKRVPNVYGQEPRDATFSKGMIELTTTMPKPGDPHCCPTGMKRYRIPTG